MLPNLAGSFGMISNAIKSRPFSSVPFFLSPVDSKPSVNENADPSEGLMSMLKKIYTDGDDEMKRTINKAWSESQEKKIRGEEGMMDF